MRSMSLATLAPSVSLAGLWRQWQGGVVADGAGSAGMLSVVAVPTVILACRPQKVASRVAASGISDVAAGMLIGVTIAVVILVCKPREVACSVDAACSSINIVANWRTVESMPAVVSGRHRVARSALATCRSPRAGA